MLDVKHSVPKNNYIEVNDTFNIEVNKEKASKVIHNIESTAEDFLLTEEGEFYNYQAFRLYQRASIPNN